jgi:hypothetical protein
MQCLLEFRSSIPVKCDLLRNAYSRACEVGVRTSLVQFLFIHLNLLVRAETECTAVTMVTGIRGLASGLVAALLEFLAATVFVSQEAREFAVTGDVLVLCMLPISFPGDRLIPHSIAATKQHHLQLSSAVRNYLSHTDDFPKSGPVYAGKPQQKVLIIGSVTAAGCSKV